jgi:hypothetical protein
VDSSKFELVCAAAHPKLPDLQEFTQRLLGGFQLGTNRANAQSMSRRLVQLQDQLDLVEQDEGMAD